MLGHKLAKILVCTRSMSTITKSQMARNILRLEERGFWMSKIPEKCEFMEKRLMTSAQTIYSGFDPTADSLHIGNLLILISLIHCQRAGHQPMALIGEATAGVGDPSGKNSQRPQVDSEFIEKNTVAIKNCIEKVFDNHAKYIARTDQMPSEKLLPVKIVNNMSWYQNFEAISFIKDVGSQVRMGNLLRRSLLKDRLDNNEPFSVAEFTYQLLQGYDWVHLSSSYDCHIQIGGSDQLGNLQAGKDMISKIQNQQVLALTIPLLLNENGEKFGKSEGNAIWLDPAKTPPYAFYSFFNHVPDSEVERLLNLFTFLPLSVIKQIMNFQREYPKPRKAQKRLAREVTLLVHGEKGLKSAQSTAAYIKGNDPTALYDMCYEDIVGATPHATTSTQTLRTDTNVMDAVMATPFFSSEEVALDAIVDGRISINKSCVRTPLLVLFQGVHIIPFSNLSVINLGKFKTHIITWQH